MGVGPERVTIKFIHCFRFIHLLGLYIFRFIHMLMSLSLDICVRPRICYDLSLPGGGVTVKS